MIRWILFFSAISSMAFCQQMVEGVVVDKATGSPIPFASIIVVGTAQGTSSNLYGQFSISVSEPFSLKVTCIGFESQVVNSVEAASRIALQPTVTQLDVVLVSSKPVRPRLIVTKAFDRVDENYNDQPFLQKFFYRHYCKDDDTYGRLIEAFIDVWKKKGYRTARKSAGDKEEIRITQLRRSLDRTKLSNSHEPISVKEILETDLVGYQAEMPSTRILFYNNVSNLKVDFENYVFALDGLSNYDGQEVYNISYVRKDTVPTPEGDYRIRSQISGSLFITTKDYAIIKREEMRSYGKDTVRTSTYYRIHDERYYPYHFTLSGESHGAASHSFHVELVSVDVRQDPSQEFTGQIPGKQELLNIPYDSVFWANATILKTTPLEDDIISDLGGGASLSKQFDLYRKYETSIMDGGINGEQKFTWLKENSRGRRVLYLVFWSPDFRSYLSEMERVKQLHKQYRDQITFVFLSFDDDTTRWEQTVQRYNLRSDGIINYRIGSNSSVMPANGSPVFMLIGKDGTTYDLNAKRPSDPMLKEDFALLIDQK